MAKYILKRVLMAVITLFVVICLTFFLMNAVPGSPWLSERSPSQATIDALNAKYGMDKPVIVQLGMYLEDLLHLDFRESIKMQKDRPVLDIIVNMPGFVVATLLLHTLTGGLPGVNLFPATFVESDWRSYVLPCLSLGFYPMCYLSRQTRTAMLDSISQEYIKTARAKGLKNGKIIFKHALRNALIPVITYLGPQIAFTLCGGFVVETVFTIPGLGRYFVQSITNRDYPLIMGTTIFLAAFIIIMNLVVDLLYKLVDPRINLSKGGN